MAVKSSTIATTAVENKDSSIPTVNLFNNIPDATTPEQEGVLETPSIPMGVDSSVTGEGITVDDLEYEDKLDTRSVKRQIEGKTPTEYQLQREAGTGFGQSINMSLNPATGAIDPEKLEPIKWEITKPNDNLDLSSSDGGLYQRLQIGVNDFNNNTSFGLGGKSKLKPIFEVEGGLDESGKPTNEFLQIGLAVTEEAIYNASFFNEPMAEGDIRLAPQFDSGKDKFLGTSTDGVTELEEYKDFTKQGLNVRLGKAIHNYHQLSKGNQTPAPLDTDSAMLLGDSFLEAYHLVHPDLLGLSEAGNQAKGTKTFILKPQGGDTLKASADVRARLLASGAKEPMKVKPRNNKYLGAGRLQQKGKGSSKLKLLDDAQIPESKGTEAIVEEAKANAASVGHVVDDRRLSFLYLMLPSLVSDKPTGNPELDNMMATALGFGKDKQVDFFAKQEKESRNIESPRQYNAFEEIKQLKVSKAQQISAIARNKDGVNYNTFFHIPFNYRISAEQVGFNATNSKSVRQVTRGVSGVPIRKGSRTERNYLEAVAMMLIPDAGRLLPKERIRAAKNPDNVKMLLRWGRRLKDANKLDANDVKIISDLIANAVPMNDPRFVKAMEGKQLGLDPEIDADLIKYLTKRGADDAIAVMDGLVDFVDYHEKVVMNGGTHVTYFNAYMDGKTNGIAITGVMFGLENVAFRTGVMRNQDVELIDENKDIRDQLTDYLTDHLETVGMTGIGRYEANVQADLSDVVGQVFKDRSLHKYTTMTLGYNKELQTFEADIADSIYKVKATGDFRKRELESQGASQETINKDPQVILASKIDSLMKSEITPEDIAEMTIGTYIQGLYEVMSPFMFDVRAINKSIGLISAMTDEPIVVRTITDELLTFSGSVQETYDDIVDREGTVKYSIKYANKAKADEAFDKLINERLKDKTIPNTNVTFANALKRNGIYDFEGIAKETVESLTELGFSIKQATYLKNEADKAVETIETGKRTQPTAYTYKNVRMSGSAPKKPGGSPGRKAMVSTQVGLVQSVDAMTMASTLSGKSWEKINSAGKGNPYIFPIYDAIKVDMNTFDVARKEINDNFFRIAFDYNIVEELGGSANIMLSNFKKKMNKLIADGNKPLDISYGTEYQMLSFLTSFDQFGKPRNLYTAFKDATGLPMKSNDKMNAPYVSAKIVRMLQQGYDIDFNKLQENPQLTPKQIKGFVSVIESVLGMRTRHKRIIKDIEDNKSRMMSKIKSLSEENPDYTLMLQYYDH